MKLTKDTNTNTNTSTSTPLEFSPSWLSTIPAYKFRQLPRELLHIELERLDKMLHRLSHTIETMEEFGILECCNRLLASTITRRQQLSRLLGVLENSMDNRE